MFSCADCAAASYVHARAIVSCTKRSGSVLAIQTGTKGHLLCRIDCLLLGILGGHLREFEMLCFEVPTGTLSL
jgi:ribosomal protein S27E